MRFKQFLSELHNIEAGQAIQAHEPSTEGSVAITNPIVMADVNFRLVSELNDFITSPELGIQKIRKVLHRFGFDLPALYEPDPEGDELAINLEAQFSQAIDWDSREPKDESPYYIYIIYYLTDDGRYEFHAELTDEDGLNEILSDEEEPEEEK
jgi:hypothetical protein